MGGRQSAERWAGLLKRQMRRGSLPLEPGHETSIRPPGGVFQPRLQDVMVVPPTRNPESPSLSDKYSRSRLSTWANSAVDWAANA